MSKREPYVSVNLTPAMSGYFATLYTWTRIEGIDGWFPEPEQTGIGRYATWQEANVEGKLMAENFGVKFIPATAEAVAQATKTSDDFLKFTKAIRELRENDPKLSFAEAYSLAEKQTGYVRPSRRT